jgi:hypothetical protein
MSNTFNWKDRKNTYYYCSVCNGFTKPDEWASETACINCGPKEDEIEQYMNNNIITGEN